MLLRGALIISCLLMLVLTTTATEPIESIYTDIAANKCRTLELNEEAALSVQECPGVANYKLKVIDHDAKVDVTVVTPNGKEYQLNFLGVVSQSFSSIGEKAEWRVIKQNGKTVPVALIIRFNANENPDDFNKYTSYLTVSKITPNEICITDKIKPMANANQLARQSADGASQKSCLKPLFKI